MVELIIATSIPLITFFIGYGMLKEKVRSNREISDARWDSVTKELDAMKDNHENASQTLTDIKVSLSEIKSDLKYVKLNLEKIERKQYED